MCVCGRDFQQQAVGAKALRPLQRAEECIGVTSETDFLPVCCPLTGDCHVPLG